MLQKNWLYPYPPPGSFYRALIIRNEYVHRAKSLRRAISFWMNHSKQLIYCTQSWYKMWFHLIPCTLYTTDHWSEISPNHSATLSLAPPSERFRSTHSDFLRTVIYCMFYSKNSQSIVLIALYFICYGV